MVIEFGLNLARLRIIRFSFLDGMPMILHYFYYSILIFTSIETPGIEKPCTKDNKIRVRILTQINLITIIFNL